MTQKKVKDTAQVLAEEVFNKTIDVDLTEQEITERGRSLAHAEKRKIEIGEELIRVKKKYKAKLDEIDVDIAKYMNAIDTDSEPRTLKVYYRYHEPEMSKQSLYNYETRELIAVEDMSEDQNIGENEIKDEADAKEADSDQGADNE